MLTLVTVSNDLAVVVIANASVGTSTGDIKPLLENATATNILRLPLCPGELFPTAFVLRSITRGANEVSRLAKLLRIAHVGTRAELLIVVHLPWLEALAHAERMKVPVTDSANHHVAIVLFLAETVRHYLDRFGNTWTGNFALVLDVSNGEAIR